MGSTDNLQRRLDEHFAGKVKATKNRRPLKLIYTEEYMLLGEARKREMYLKTHAGRKRLKELLKNFTK